MGWSAGYIKVRLPIAPFAILMLEDFDAAESADATVVLIVAKSQLYGGLYLLALVTFALLWLLPPWWRWIAGFCVAMVLIAALSMARALHILHRANRFYRRGDRVLLHHRLMNAATSFLLSYALAGVWMGLPASFIAVLAAAVLNFFHYAGYHASAERITARSKSVRPHDHIQ